METELTSTVTAGQTTGMTHKTGSPSPKSPSENHRGASPCANPVSLSRIEPNLPPCNPSRRFKFYLGNASGSPAHRNHGFLPSTVCPARSAL